MKVKKRFRLGCIALAEQSKAWGFVIFVSSMARQLGIPGYAKNLRDGHVEVYAIGTPGKFAALRKELQRGPRSAVVSDVTEEEVAIQPKFEHGFSIERDSYEV